MRDRDVSDDDLDPDPPCEEIEIEAVRHLLAPVRLVWSQDQPERAPSVPVTLVVHSGGLARSRAVGIGPG